MNTFRAKTHAGLYYCSTTVLVDRGWVHKSLLNPDTRQKGQILGQVEIYGALRNAEVRNKFTPIEKLGSSNFHVRDIDAMAKALGTVPVFLEALKGEWTM